MPSKAKKLDRAVARLPTIPKELVEQHKTHYVHFRKKSDE